MKLATLPLASLLAQGGDSRLFVGANGRTRYGCRPVPNDATPFGSCTASSPGPRAWQGAERARKNFVADLAAVGAERAADRACHAIRREIHSLLELDEAVESEIVLTPSGTDAELVAALLGLGLDQSERRRLCNVVVGPSEIGSGSALAAAGLYFDAHVPRGGLRTSGQPLPGGLADRIEVQTVALRDERGEPRLSQDIDDEVCRRVERSIAAGDLALVHVVAHSKTGAHAPSLATARALRAAHPHRVTVVVDAAQGRFSRRGLIDVLQDGFIALFTGSKFYGGPPFCGALLVPHTITAELDRVVTPAGFADFFDRWEWPVTHAAARAQLPPGVNPGLIVRWAGALAEMNAYYDCSGARRLDVLRAFEHHAPGILQSAECIDLLPVHAPVQDDELERLLESKTTVFGFRMRRLDGASARMLTLEELRDVQRWLVDDASALLRPGHPDQDALRTPLHLGQPVELGTTAGAALRVAIGGPLIVRVAEDAELGTTFERRLLWMRKRLEMTAQKLDAIARNFGAMRAEERP